MRRINLATLGKNGLIQSGDILVWQRKSENKVHKVVITPDYFLQSGDRTFRTPSSAAKTVERIVDVFPAEQQEQARLQVSTSLLGILSQTLCKNTAGKRSLAYELLVNTPAIGNLIRERKVSQIYSQLQTGSRDGMNTLEQCLIKLMQEGSITQQEALSKAGSPKMILNAEN